MKNVNSNITMFNTISPLNDTYFPSLSKLMSNIDDNYYVKKFEKDGVYSVVLKLPGYEKEEVEVNLKIDELTRKKYIVIKAENKEYGKYTDTFIVKNEILESSVKASLKNGILTISFSLEKPKNSKHFQVKIE